MKRWFALCLLCFLFVPIFAHADDWTEAEGYFTVYTEDQQTLFTYSGEISVDDEYIGADNRLYRVVSIDLPQRTAIATFQGVEEMPNVQWLRMTSAIPVSASNRNKVIALYVTHSDESYKPTDGVSSNDHGGGIYDVAKSFQDALE
ncbi:MAG: stage II sporulation protein P, partial [Clostridia bacterium]